MRTQTAITAILFYTILASCHHKSSEATVSLSDTTVNHKTNGIDTVQTPHAIENTAIAFLTWYRDNRAKLSTFQLVDNASGESYDSTKYYAVNFVQTEKYLRAIKASGFVSSAYVENCRDYFRKADEHLQANPQNDGPPEFFEYDLVMQSQDVDLDLVEIEKAKSTSQTITTDKAVVAVSLTSGQKLRLSLTRHALKWLIDNIESITGQ